MSETGQSILIITLLVLNCIGAAIYYFANTAGSLGKERSILIKTIVIILCPVVGLVFIGLRTIRSSRQRPKRTRKEI